MKKTLTYIYLVLTGVLSVASCNKQEEDFLSDDLSGSADMELKCVFENNTRVSYASGELGTRSLINQTSNTDQLLCNFLRLDAIDQGDWNKAYLSEGTVATVPTGDYDLRSISLHPAQPYNTSDRDSRSKMVGWYPKTDDVPQTAQGNDVTVQYSNFTQTNVVREGKTCIKFTGLDGSIDLMVSDMKEGSYNTPFGDSNYFTFQHYLSAIRVYAKAEKSAQDIGLWKDIEEVVIRKQPTSCIVSLPTTVGSYGDVVEWGAENAKFKIQKDHIFGENDTDYPLNQIADQYPIRLDGSDVEKYLGYSLIQPNQELIIQVHTGSGIYTVVIPDEYGTNKEKIFNPGYIYDIHLSFKTDGAIFAFIESDGNERYFDLSAGQEYENDGNKVYDYKNANCYIIDSDPESEDMYDGYCFDATVVGNGDGGIISTGAQTFYPQNPHIEPYSAEVLWQTSPRLVSQIELLYGYVRFKVTKKTETTYEEGNAVIAVYDKDRNVLWSWHIWITDTPQDLTYKEGETSITIMDRNLGAILGGTPQSPEEALATYGLYYQWGRKDPSMGPPAYNYSPINMTTAPYYDYSSERKDAAEVVRFATPTLQDAVENPMFLVMPTMLTQTYSFNWLYEKIDFLWGYSKTTGYTHKTIYDPCPYGYRVSGGELADLFTYASGSIGEIVDGEFGQEVKVPKVDTNTSDKVSIFFPYSGYKGVDRGLNSLISSWKYVGQKGDYQSSIVSMYTGDNEYYMHRSRIYLSKDRTWNELNVGDYTGHQIQDHTNRRTAAPVRCVRNEEHKRLMAFITPDKYTISSRNDIVNFTLYSYAFGSNVTSATLSIGYHLENDSSTHHEYVIGSWTEINSPLWQPEVYNFDFNEITDDKGNPLNLNSTTGEFRFILTVKSSDNINKMSSTTIRIQKKHVEFLNWANEETFFAGTAINKNFRIYGDAKPTKVEIMQVGSGQQEDVLKLDVTNKLQSNSGSEYPYDYNCSTAGLSFNTPGDYYIYLRITLENGQVLETQHMKFIIEASQWTEVTDISQINTNDVYLIMNVNSDDFAYDNGNDIYAKAVYDDACYFKFEGSSNNWLIKNVSTEDYASISGYSIRISEDKSNSAAKFVFDYNTEGKYFKIGTKLRKTHNYYYYLRQIEGSSVITIATGDSNVMRWKIYKQSTSQNQ